MPNERVTFYFVMVVVFSIWLLGGYRMIRNPDEMIQMNKRYVPSQCWALIERIGLTTRSVYTAVGIFGVVVGAVALPILIYLCFSGW